MDRRLRWSALLNAAITAAEVVGGILSGSLALLADALHNLSDVVALGLAIVARALSRRPPSAQHTYGLKRVEVLSALVNALVLFGNDKDKAAEPAAPKPQTKNGKKGKTDEADESPHAPLEFASSKDYQLSQATNLLKAWQIIKR